MTPTAYMEREDAQQIFSCAATYKKKETTALRLPSAMEMGMECKTYKFDATNPNGFSVESVNKITDDVVVARNSNAVLGKINGKPVYNEWLVPKATVEKNYSAEVLADLGDEFTERQKKASVKAVELTDSLLEKLGVEKGQPLQIKVSWSPEPMIAHKGDFITDQGYSIAAKNMQDYGQVPDPTKKAQMDVMASRFSQTLGHQEQEVAGHPWHISNQLIFEKMNTNPDPKLYFLMDAHLVATFRGEEVSFIGCDPQGAKPFYAVADAIANTVESKYGLENRSLMEQRSGQFSAASVHAKGEFKPDIPLIFETEALVYVDAQSIMKEKEMAFTSSKLMAP